jgi:hypothetical protein
MGKRSSLQRCPPSGWLPYGKIKHYQMRIIKELALQSGWKCTIFSWNGKFLLKLENGPLEQTYKISELDISGPEELENWIQSPEFQQKASAVFKEMDSGLDALFS